MINKNKNWQKKILKHELRFSKIKTNIVHAYLLHFHLACVEMYNLNSLNFAPQRILLGFDNEGSLKGLLTNIYNFTVKLYTRIYRNQFYTGFYVYI